MSETPIEQAVTAVEAEAVPAADAAASALQADVTAKMDELRQSMPGLVEELVAKAHEIGGAMLSRFHEVVATVEQHLGMAQPPAPVEGGVQIAPVDGGQSLEPAHVATSPDAPVQVGESIPVPTDGTASEVGVASNPAVDGELIAEPLVAEPLVDEAPVSPTPADGASTA